MLIYAFVALIMYMCHNGKLYNSIDAAISLSFRALTMGNSYNTSSLRLNFNLPIPHKRI